MSRNLVIASNQFGTGSGTPVNAYPFTIALWFNTTNLSPGADQHLFTMGNGSNNNMFVGIQNAGKVFGGVSNSTGTFDVVFSGSNTTANAWHSLVWSCAGITSRTLYLDGVSVGTSAVSIDVGGGSNTAFWFGSYEAGASDVAGQMAELAVANVAWTVNEALAFTAGERPTRIRPASIKLYTPLFGLASPEPDLSGNKFNFTLTGSPLQGASHPPMTFSTSLSPSNIPVVVAAAGYLPYNPWPQAGPILAT